MLTGQGMGMTYHEQRDQSLAEVIAVARAAVEQEFQITERLDAKARGQVTLAGQWFAIAQAVSAVAFAAKGGEGLLLWLVAATAVIGGGVLVIVFVKSAQVWRLREEKALSPQGILQLRDKALADESPLEATTRHYASTLQKRRATNVDRRTALECAETWWYAGMAFPLVQIILALAVRLFA